MPKVSDPQCRVRRIDIPKDALAEWEMIARRLVPATISVLDGVTEMRQHPSLDAIAQVALAARAAAMVSEGALKDEALAFAEVLIRYSRSGLRNSKSREVTHFAPLPDEERARRLYHEINV